MQNMRKWIALFLTMLLPVLPAAAEEESTMLTGKTATEIVEMMGFGWNLGNTLDATGGNTADVTAQEQSWGNAKITPELMVRVKEAGFDTIRIPVTWYRYTSDDGTYTIREDFLQHVREVVEWAREADLFVILNVHHEAWINEPNFAADAEKIGEQLTAMWRQIADTFADFDQHVIFEGMNEPRAQGTNYEWSGNAACYAAVNYLNQVFVNTIRKDAKGCNLGIIPDGIVSRGPLGLVSKSGTLTYQLMGELSDIGFTACLGAGGDPIVGTTLQEALEAFENDEATKAVVMIGEIGGSAEQDAAKWASEHMTKPVVAYIAGFTAPEGKQMGHAGAIVSGGKGTAQDKKEALEAVGIRVGRTPGQTAEIMREVLASQSL